MHCLSSQPLLRTHSATKSSPTAMKMRPYPDECDTGFGCKVPFLGKTMTVSHLWAGFDENRCNACSCVSGELRCTKKFCGASNESQNDQVIVLDSNKTPPSCLPVGDWYDID